METLYTKLYKDFLTSKVGPTPDAPTYATQFSARLIEVYGSSTGNAIYNMLNDLYYFHEICYEDLNDFYIALWNKLESYSSYYIELLAAYQTSINMLDGRKTVTSREGSNEATGNNMNTKGSTDKAYNLPNKTINNGKGNLTSQNENNATDESHSSGSNEYSETITTTGGENVIELKKQYLALIHDYIRDWCMKCEDCFLQIYS